MPLISAADIASARAALEIFLVHTYTRQPMTGGVEDSEGNTPPVPDGAAATGIPCAWGTGDRVVRDEGGTTIVTVPTLMVSPTDSLKVGDHVSAVTDSLGGVLHPGPLRVERIFEAASGLGAALLVTWELRGARAV